MTTIPKPTPGRIVNYTSKIDNGAGNDVVSPAVVLRTRSTTVAAVIDRWGPEPATVTSASDPEVTHETTARPESVIRDLPDDSTIDLLVHGLGRDYREYAVPFGTGPGTWRYPDLTREVIEVGGSLRVGAKVRYIGNEFDFAGKVGTVLEVNPGLPYPILVDFPSRKVQGGFPLRADELEVIQ